MVKALSCEFGGIVNVSSIPGPSSIDWLSGNRMSNNWAVLKREKWVIPRHEQQNKNILPTID